MQNRLAELEKEGNDFLNETGYTDLPELAKMNVNAYMRGMKEGMALAMKQKTEHQDDAVVA